MSDLHYFAAVWPDGASRWTLIFRSDSEEEVFDRLAAWEACQPPGSRGFHIMGALDAGIGPAKLDKELRRLPHRRSPSFDFMFEALARRVCRANRMAEMTTVVWGPAGPFVVKETKQ